MDNEPSTPPENPQDEIPEVDRRTVVKALAMASALLVVLGGFFLMINGKLLNSDSAGAYASVTEMMRHVNVLKTPRPAPIAEYSTLVPIDDRTFRRVPTHLADFKGERLFVVMWATWCRPCHPEMRVLDRLAPELRAAGLRVVPIMTADKVGPDGARAFYRSEKIVNMPINLDTERDVLNGFGVGNLPVGGFIDAEGNLLALTDNLDLEQPLAQDLLREFAQTGRLP